MRPRLFALSLSATLTCGSVTSSAFAEPSANERAGEHFDRGVRLYEDADFALALVEFQRSYEAAPDFRTLYNIGQVHFQLASFAEARRTLARYLDEGGARVPAARRAEVERDLEALRIRTAHLRVVVDVPGAAILIDGQRVATSPMTEAVLVNGGAHRIAVSKPGYVTVTDDVSLAGSESRSLPVQLPPAPVQQVHVTSSGLGPVWIGWGVTAALAAGTVGMATALDSAAESLSEAKRRSTTRRELEEKADAVWSRETITYALGGATLVAAGVSLYFTLARKNAAVTAPTTGSLQVGPTGVAGVF